MKTMISASLTVLLASAALGQSLDPARVELFRSILKDNNCTLAESDAGDILPRYEFTREETRAIVGALVEAGEVRLDGRTLSLVDDRCGPDDPVASLLARPEVQQFIAIMAEHSCAISEADAESVFPPRGMDKARVREIVTPMMQADMASFENGVLRVDAAYCSANGAAVASSQEPDRTGMFGMTRVRQLVDAMAQNNCSLNMEVADGFLAEIGMEHSFATNIARKMLADGYASMIDGQILQLSAPYCLPAAAPAMAEASAAPQAAASGGGLEAAFIAVAVQNNCALGIADAQGALGNAGVRLDQAFRIVDIMVADGRATLSAGGDVVTLDPALCAGGGQPAPEVEAAVEAPTQTVTPPAAAPAAASVAPDDPRAGVLAMLAANGCEITQENAADMIAAAGLDYNSTMQILTQMMGAGEAVSPDGGQTLQVGAPLCVSAAAEPLTPRAAFINLIKQNNCSITAAEFGNLLPVDGLDAPTAFGLISELEAEGVISLPATRDVVTLSAEMCR